MKVTIKESDLRSYLKGLLFEKIGPRTMAAGDKTTMGTTGDPITYDGKISGADQPPGTEETTLGEELPLNPADQMAVQLTQEKPPIEDPEFIPANVEELSRSANALTQMVPAEKVQSFYNNLKDLVSKASEEDDEESLPPGADEKMPVEQEAERVEAVEPYDEDEDLEEGIVRYLDSTLKRLIHEAVGEEWNPAWGPEPNLEKELPRRGQVGAANKPASHEDEEAIYQELADELGFSSAGGAKAFEQRARNKFAWLKKELPDAERQRLKTIATSRFISALNLAGAIDADEKEELMLNRDVVRSLPSFEFFYRGTFMGNVYDKLKKEANKRVKIAVKELGIPARTQQTVINQALGLVAQDERKLMKKLIKDATLEGMDATSIEALGKTVLKKLPDIKELAKIPTDGVADKAAAMYDQLSNAKKVAALTQAMEEMDAGGLAAVEKDVDELEL